MTLNKYAAFSTLGYLTLASTLSTRNFGTFGSKVSVLDCMALGSALSTRSMARIGSSLSCAGVLRVTTSVSLGEHVLRHVSRNYETSGQNVVGSSGSSVAANDIEIMNGNDANFYMKVMEKARVRQLTM